MYVTRLVTNVAHREATILDNLLLRVLDYILHAMPHLSSDYAEFTMSANKVIAVPVYEHSQSSTHSSL